MKQLLLFLTTLLAACGSASEGPNVQASIGLLETDETFTFVVTNDSYAKLVTAHSVCLKGVAYWYVPASGALSVRFGAGSSIPLTCN